LVKLLFTSILTPKYLKPKRDDFMLNIVNMGLVIPYTSEFWVSMTASEIFASVLKSVHEYSPCIEKMCLINNILCYQLFGSFCVRYLFPPPNSTISLTIGRAGGRHIEHLCAPCNELYLKLVHYLWIDLYNIILSNCDYFRLSKSMCTVYWIFLYNEYIW